MENDISVPESTIAIGSMPRSVAFEMRAGRLIIKFEEDAPYASQGRETYLVTEGPSLCIGGRKFTVTAIA